MTRLHNLIVDLGSLSAGVDDAEESFGAVETADERGLAWIDATFGGWWSSEAAVGENAIARRDGEPVGFATVGARGLRFRWLDGLAREPGVGLFGPFGVAPRARSGGLGGRLLRAGLAHLKRRGYARALIAAVGDDLVAYYAGAVGARVAETFDRDALLAPAPRTVVMASGNGSNFAALLEAQRAGQLALQVEALVSNRPGAYALTRAREAGIPAVAMEWERAREPRVAYDACLRERVRECKPELVLLLGWMHLLAGEFVEAFPDLLNLHPAFLPLDPARDDVVMPDGTRIPAFRGPRALDDALSAGSRWVGASVHRVTAQTDRGPVLARAPIAVERGEEAAALAERVHRVEHRLVPTAVRRWLYERPRQGLATG